MIRPSFFTIPFLIPTPDFGIKGGNRSRTFRLPLAGKTQSNGGEKKGSVKNVLPTCGPSVLRVSALVIVVQDLREVCYCLFRFAYSVQPLSSRSSQLEACGFLLPGTVWVSVCPRVPVVLRAARRPGGEGRGKELGRERDSDLLVACGV